MFSLERETHTNKAAVMGTENSTRSVSKNIIAAGKYFLKRLRVMENDWNSYLVLLRINELTRKLVDKHSRQHPNLLLLFCSCALETTKIKSNQQSM